jgi:hypothetical protein
VKPSARKLKEQFLAWQCRIRQIAMREHGGRPSPGMRPRLVDDAGLDLAPALTVLLVPRDPAETTDLFRFQVMRFADPRDLYERALAYLQADYFQRPESFSDRLLAVLPERSPVAAALAAQERCMLLFAQWRQSYRLPSTAVALEPGDAAREAALWHNRQFNPALPETVHVIAFQPDWAKASASRDGDGEDAAPL